MAMLYFDKFSVLFFLRQFAKMMTSTKVINAPMDGRANQGLDF